MSAAYPGGETFCKLRDVLNMHSPAKRQPSVLVLAYRHCRTVARQGLREEKLREGPFALALTSMEQWHLLVSN